MTFFTNYEFKNKAISNIKLQEVIGSIGLDNVGIYLKDGPFSSDIRILNLLPSKETHWVVYVHENYFVSFGYAPPNKLSNFMTKRNAHCFYSEYKTQGLTKKEPYCASYCLYIIYLTKVVRLDF